MKSFLQVCLAYFLLFVPLYLSLLVLIYHSDTAKYIPNVVDKTKNNGFLLSRLREIPKYENVDFLFLGSSHACREFDPRIFKQFGFTSFNLGSSAQTPLNSEYLFEKYVGAIKPKHLIIEVYFLLFGNDGVESAIDIISNSEIDHYNLTIALSKVNLKVFNTISSVIINRAFDPIDNITEHQLKTDKYVSGGYIEKILRDSINQRLTTSHKRQKISISQDQVDALIRTIDLATTKGTKVTLVAAPVTEELLNQYDNYEVFYQLIKSIAEKHKANYIDYNYQSYVQFNSYTDFYDTNHLTQKGVRKFNHHLIKNVLTKEKKVLPPTDE